MADETEPLWLSKDNDHLLQKEDEESEALFGTGNIPLDGEVTDHPTPIPDVESQPSNSNYGSIKEESPSLASSNKSKKNKKKQTKQNPPTTIFDDEVEDKKSYDNSSVSDADDDDLTMESTKPHMPNRNWCLAFFRLVAGVTVLASLGLLVTQLLPLIFGGIQSQGYFDLALKVYVALFCLLFLLVEFDAPVPVIRNSFLLQAYLSRGFIYSFLGLICLQEAYSERVKEIVSTHADEFHVAWASLFMQISSWLIFACGIFYMFMGICCLKRLRDKLREKDKKAWKKYRKELKEWKRLNT